MDDKDIEPPAESPAPDGSAPSSATTPDAEVGYGKPPKHTRFVKGRSGNPKGRPRKVKAATFIDELFDQVCGHVNVGGEQHDLTGLEAMYRGISREALRGNVKAAAAILEAETTLMNEAAMATGEQASAKEAKGGLLIVPARAPSYEQWEAIAIPSQRKLIEETRLPQEIYD